MSGDGAIANIGDLAKPITTLIEKIAGATGILYEPTRIEKAAVAEGKALIIRAHAEVEANDVRRRALERFVGEEERKQQNIESITSKAIPLLEASASPNEMDNDWVANFFDKCRLISDGDMQILWAKVLAGEANSAGTYCKRTINFLSTLDKHDAQLFNALCCATWNVNKDIPVIASLNDDFLRLLHIDSDGLRHLDDIGLIALNPHGFYENEIPSPTPVSYFNERYEISFEHAHVKNVDIGYVLFTNVGHELLSVCDPTPREAYRNAVLEYWRGNTVIAAVRQL